MFHSNPTIKLFEYIQRGISPAQFVRPYRSYYPYPITYTLPTNHYNFYRIEDYLGMDIPQQFISYRTYNINPYYYAINNNRHLKQIDLYSNKQHEGKGIEDDIIEGKWRASPFPMSYPDLLIEDERLKTSLATAIAEARGEHPTLKLENLVISIVDVSYTEPLTFKHAGFRFLENHYTASLVKVAVLYAAFELRKSVNQIVEKAAGGGVTSPSVLFQNIRSEYDQWITGKFREILSKLEITLTPKIEAVITPPKYEEIFNISTISSGGLTTLFKEEFDKNLHKMIIDGDNNAAARCIEALGYSWINGTLNAGRFFLPEEIKSGIWVGGSFTGSIEPIRIQTKNDGPAAQVAQTYMLANLYAHMVQGTLVDDGSSAEMLQMLQASASIGKFPSLLDYKRRDLPSRTYSVTHSKIGLGPLKTGAMVGSDGAIVEYKLSDGTPRKFIVIFQNYLYEKDTLEPIGYIVDRTLELYVKGL